MSMGVELKKQSLKEYYEKACAKLNVAPKTELEITLPIYLTMMEFVVDD